MTLLFSINAVPQTPTPSAMTLDYAQTIVPQGLQPKDIKPLYIVVRNTGGLPARDVRVDIPTTGGGLYTEGPSGSDVTSGGSWFLGSINPGGSAQIVSSVRVDEDPRIGTHYLIVYVTYDESRYDSMGRLVSEEKKTKWLLPVEVQSGSLLELSDYDVDPAKLTSADNVKLVLTLENTGESDAQDITSYLGMPNDGSPASTEANLQLSRFFTVLGASQKKIGDLAKDMEKDVELDVHIDEQTPSKAYTLPVTAEYEDRSGTKHVDVFYVGVYVSGGGKITVSDFQTDPMELHSDDREVQFKGLIENQGAQQVKNIKLTFNPKKPVLNSRSFIQTKQVGVLRASQSIPFTFYGDVEDDISPQQTEVGFLLEYEVNNQKMTEEVTHKIDILDHPRFRLSVNASPTPPGRKGNAAVDVENIGSECDGVTLIVLEKRDQPLSFSDKSMYIGDMKQADSGKASFT
ncbi:MAG: hypothetical protein GF334_00130, partial [Candidatus Altiarchaeales archaeon]|nr:hypothetical protein [Candidatus Altiarchaeales archaeon]